ncbi:hypothetical protein [Fulvivirga sp. M361]|uniref:hypothetical protein n=1 Tax=Fulvivirga sp. M361 TaxID=2594266 RepID=UPI00117AF30D|nr:hypothetical protein [Fulvivirga sp. M361]
MKKSIYYFSIFTVFCLLFIGCSEEDTEPNIVNCRIRNYQYDNGFTSPNSVSDTRSLSYNYSNDLVSSIDLNINLSGKTYNLSAQLKYDDQNRIVSIKADDENYVGITYDGLSIEVQTTRSQLSDPIMDQYTLNDKGQIIKRDGYVSERYEYNDEDQLVRVYSLDNGEEYLASEFQYDNKPNPFERIPVEINWAIPAGEDAQIWFDFSFKNMGPNNILKADYFNSNGDLSNTNEYAFNYDSNDYPISSTTGLSSSNYSYDSCN